MGQRGGGGGGQRGGGGPGGGAGGGSRLAPNGTYRIVLIVDGQEHPAQTVRIERDPGAPLSAVLEDGDAINQVAGMSEEEEEEEREAEEAERELEELLRRREIDD